MPSEALIGPRVHSITWKRGEKTRKDGVAPSGTVELNQSSGDESTLTGLGRLSIKYCSRSRAIIKLPHLASARPR